MRIEPIQQPFTVIPGEEDHGLFPEFEKYYRNGGKDKAYGIFLAHVVNVDVRTQTVSMTMVFWQDNIKNPNAIFHIPFVTIYYENDTFRNAGIRNGQDVAFQAKAYAFRNPTGSLEFGLCECTEIKDCTGVIEAIVSTFPDGDTDGAETEACGRCQEADVCDHLEDAACEKGQAIANQITAAIQNGMDLHRLDQIHIIKFIPDTMEVYLSFYLRGNDPVTQEILFIAEEILDRIYMVQTNDQQLLQFHICFAVGENGEQLDFAPDTDELMADQQKR